MATVRGRFDAGFTDCILQGTINFGGSSVD